MLIDCNTCVARGRACPDCVVTMFLDGPRAVVDLDDEEQQAIEQLSAAGLVPPLRLVPLVRPAPNVRRQTHSPGSGPEAAAG